MLYRNKLQDFYQQKLIIHIEEKVQVKAQKYY